MRDPINAQEMRDIMDGDEALMKECFQDFLGESEKMLSYIREAIDRQDRDGLEKRSHALKGTLKYLAAEPAAQVAYELECIGRDNRLSEAPAALEKLQRECGRIHDYIHRY